MKETKNPVQYIIFAILVLVVGGLSFFGGVAYQKAQKTTTSDLSANGTPGGAGGFGSPFGNGGIGTVTAISDTSISIAPRTRGSSDTSTSSTPKTYTITTSTTFTNNGSTASESDIAVGDSVLIQTGTSDTTTATSILINPSFGGEQSSSEGSSDNSSN
jgi:hypothetical protein